MINGFVIMLEKIFRNYLKIKSMDSKKQLIKVVTDSQKDGFEICLKILKDINERLKQNKRTEALFLQTIITELDRMKEELFKTENK